MKVPKLIAIEEFGEGYIKLPKEWNDYDPLLKADLLKDWLYALESQYKAALVEMDAQSIIRRAMVINKEVYFCSRCGKQVGNDVHSCIPPKNILRK